MDGSLDDALRDLLDLNYRVASARVFASSDIGEALETRDLQLATCGHPVAEFNWALLKTTGGEVERGVARAEAYYGERGFPFRFIVRSDQAEGAIDALLRSKGYAPLEARTPGMCLEAICQRPPPPPDLEIRRVRSDADLTDFQLTCFRGFGIPVEFGARFLTADLLRSPESALFTAYREGEPAATAMVQATGPIAGIYWVATLEAHRRRGCAEAATWAALGAGREFGCRVGSLQASEMGRPVYERMGFIHSADYTNYQRPEAEAAPST